MNNFEKKQNSDFGNYGNDSLFVKIFGKKPIKLLWLWFFIGSTFVDIVIGIILSILFPCKGSFCLFPPIMINFLAFFFVIVPVTAVLFFVEFMSRNKFQEIDSDEKNLKKINNFLYLSILVLFVQNLIHVKTFINFIQNGEFLQSSSIFFGLLEDTLLVCLVVILYKMFKNKKYYLSRKFMFFGTIVIIALAFFLKFTIFNWYFVRDVMNPKLRLYNKEKIPSRDLNIYEDAIKKCENKEWISQKNIAHKYDDLITVPVEELRKFHGYINPAFVRSGTYISPDKNYGINNYLFYNFKNKKYTIIAKQFEDLRKIYQIVSSSDNRVKFDACWVDNSNVIVPYRDHEAYLSNREHTKELKKYVTKPEIVFILFDIDGQNVYVLR